MTPLATLLEMLTYARPCESKTEQAFIQRFIAPLPGAYVDANGNWHVKVDDSPILWSCHTDTVHRTDGRQTVHYDASTGLVELSRRSRSRGFTCLGADDTAGVFLLTEMVKREVPGYYIFHFGEECGGLGSGELAREHSDWLASTFLAAIAVDRGGMADVITHQGGRMTASTAFADSLAAILNTGPFLFTACDRGIYTDTAEYSEAISECTNVSVGYEHAHSKRETLDCGHVLSLLDVLSTVRIGDLAIVRKPAEDDRPVSRYSWSDLWDADEDETDTAPLLTLVSSHPTSDSLSSAEMAEYLEDVDRPDERSLYLWPEYGDVQAALRRYRQ